MEIMNEERVVDDIVTKFLFNTCRLRPQPTEHAVQAAVFCAALVSGQTEDDADAEFFQLSGSLAEFYIEPMLPHVGDIDIMCHLNTVLAIPQGQPPPTQLPAEFHNRVEVFEITDSHLPGYVYLELRYLLTKCADSGSYNAVDYAERELYLSIQYRYNNYLVDRHGPAYFPREYFNAMPVDIVRCVRCLTWPTQASDWPTRHRSHGWPDSAILDHVVGNGYDLVQVAHRQCKEDEWMREYQWRLSLSRAEIVLINSWMPVQQIVYHLLRVIMKTEICTESADNLGVSTLSNYHIKTLMLWACELKPHSWWTGDLSVIRICVELLHMLADWLTAAQCPHYFINNCNLVDHSFALETAASRLQKDKCWLSSWFVNYYVRLSVRICPETVSRLFDDVGTSMKLTLAVSVVVDWRLNSTAIDKWRVFSFAECFIAGSLHCLCVNSRSFFRVLMSELSKADSPFFRYFAAVAFLHVAHKIAKSASIDNYMKTLTILTSEVARECRLTVIMSAHSHCSIKWSCWPMNVKRKQ